MKPYTTSPMATPETMRKAEIMNSKTKQAYTPGPWQVSKYLENQDYPFIRTVTDGKGCKIANGVSEADAALIALAPEFSETLDLCLEACQFAIDEYNRANAGYAPKEDSKAIIMLKKAISKLQIQNETRTL